MYKSINSLALIVNGVWTSVILWSDYLNYTIFTFSIAWDLTYPSNTFLFSELFAPYWQQSSNDQLSEEDQFLCLKFLLKLFFFVPQLMIYWFLFFTTLILSKLKVHDKEFQNLSYSWDFSFFQFIPCGPFLNFFLFFLENQLLVEILSLYCL